MRHRGTLGTMSQTIELLSSSQVARLINRSPRTVQRMAARGEIPFLKKDDSPNGQYIFDAAAIRQMIERGRQ